MAEQRHSNPPGSLSELPDEIFVRITDFLPQNDIACTVRLLNKTSARLLRCKQLVRLSQPVPHHAFRWRWGRPDSMRGLSLQLRNHLLTLTARSGVLANLQLACSTAGCPLSADVFDAAAGCGHLDAYQWAESQSPPELLTPLAFIPGGIPPPCAQRAVEAAALGGQTRMVRYLLQQYGAAAAGSSKQLEHTAWRAAAQGGHRVLCEALHADGREGVHQAVVGAAHSGHAEMTGWLLQLRGPRVDRQLQDLLMPPMAVGGAYGLPLPALQGLLGQDPEGLGTSVQLRRAVAVAVSSPTADWRDKLLWLEAQGELVAPLMDYNVPWPEVVKRPDAVARVQLLRQRAEIDWGRLTSAAVAGAHLPLIGFLCEEGLAVPRFDHARTAAASGDVALLAELRGRGWPLAPNLAECAARGGHLHVLQWMEAGPGEVVALLRAALRTVDLAKAAASSGSLELVRWLREERGCPWDEQVFAAAVHSGNVELVERIAAGGCPMGASGKAYVIAARKGDTLMLRCLRHLGCPWGDGRAGAAAPAFTAAVCSPAEDFTRARRGARLEVLTWLVAEGCPVDWRAAAEAAEQREDRAGAAVRDWVRAQLLLLRQPQQVLAAAHVAAQQAEG